MDIDLSQYVRVGRFDLPEPTRTTAPINNLLAQEVSAVTYNWDTDTLFVVGDGGTAIVQIDKQGNLIDTMTLAQGSSPQGTEFYDTEGLTYIGNGQFVMTEERDRNAVQFTYAAGTTLTRANAETVNLGSNVGNVGLEGLSYDPLTGGYIFVKEKTPEQVFQTAIDFGAGTASNPSTTDLFDPTPLNLIDFADVYALSNIATIVGVDEEGNLLTLSQESGQILEVDRSGNVLSSLTLQSDPGNPLDIASQQHEGLTMDANGYLYVVSENGGGDFDHPQLWVYAPSSSINQAPSAINLTNVVSSIDENTNTVARIKVADVAISDDGLGTNGLSVSGADAAYFEVDSTGLYIKAGTVLDYETRTSYAVTVNVDDTGVGSTPDASTSYVLGVNNIVNENVAPAVYISEVAPWSSGNSPVAADWFEVTNGGSSALDITGWRMDDSSNSFASSVALNGVTSIAAGQSAIFIETSSATTVTNFINTWFGGTLPSNVQIGTYSGGGVGLSTSGDGVVLFDASGNQKASVSFGTSPASAPFTTFNNAAGLNNATLTTPSAVAQNGAFVAPGDAAEIGSPGTAGKLFISEVAPWSSGSSPVAADWFEVTNTTAFDIDISGWKMDDSSGSPAAAVALNGITTIHAGESVIFIESANPTAARASFINTWFGGNAPANLQIGTYTGSGVGLGTGGDAVNLYDTTNALRASVTFGSSPAGPSFPTFDNAAGLNGATISALSAAGTNAAFNAVNHTTEVGSPGEITPVNDAPIAHDDTSATVAEDSGAITISFASLIANDLAGPANEAGQTLTITSVSNAVGGTVSIVGTDVVFTPNANFNGAASFDYTVRDNGTSYGLNAFLSDIGTASFTINAVNDAPALTGAQAALAHGTEDTAYTVTAAQLVTGFTDVDGDTLSVANLLASNGSVTDNLDGTYTITPAVNFNGAVTLSYDVVDGNGGVTAATLGYIVDSVNDVPTALALTSASIAENSANGTLVGTLVPTDADTGDSFTYTLLDNAGGRFAVNATTGNLTVANGSLLDYEAADHYDVIAKVTDAAGATHSQTLTVNLTNVVESHSYFGTNSADVFTATSDDNWIVRGKGGNDILTTLGGGDTLYGDGGNDTLNAGAGNDIIYVLNSGGVDAVDGGAGFDVIKAGASNMAIGLTSLAGIEQITANGNSGVGIAGSAANDTLDFTNTVLTGIVAITGKAGNDILTGSAGNDTIIGGAGADILASGSGNDLFIYEAVKESGIGAKADHITDFAIGDIIDLSLIDANALVVGNQAFSFIGNANFTGLGQLRLGTDGGHVALFGNISGNLNPDFEIILDNNPVLHASDFIL